LIFIFFGMVAMLEARNYSMGTAARMGPGYLPYILGGVLILLGLMISARSLWLSGEAIEPIVLRPLLLVTISVVAFTFMVGPLGLVLATLALVVISSLGCFEFRLREVFILYVILVALAVGLFVYILSVSFRVWPQW
jgi:hypothetical protein